MRKFVSWSSAVAVVGLLVFGAATQAADEKKVPLDKLPKAVLKAP
jgi:hypothetical protein